MKKLCILVVASVLSCSLARGQQSLDISGGGVGQSLDFTLTGPPGEQYLNIMSLTTGPTCFPQVCLDVGLDLLSTSISLPGFFDVYPGSGVVSMSFPLPNDPILLALPPLNFQTALIDSGQGVVGKSNLYRVTFAQPGSFETTLENMSTGRTGAGAVTLDDGRPLIVGGGDGDLTGGTGLSSCEIYNRNLESFEDTGSMNAARFLHAVVKLQDGRVLAVGGINAVGVPLASAEIFDPTLGTWSNVSSMNRARGGHQASILPDGRVLVSGGTSDFSDALQLILNATNKTEIYDPLGNSWTAGPNMAEPKLGHVHSVLLNGDVLVTGGFTFTTLFGIPFPAVSDDAQRYTPSGGAGSFSGEISMRQDRLAHMTTRLNDGRVLLTGGASGDVLNPAATRSAEIFNPANNQFTSVGNMIDPRAAHASVLLPDGKVLVGGGADGTLAAPINLSRCEVFDPNSGTFSATGSLTQTRSLPSALGIGDGTILILGGSGGGGSSSLSSVDVYQPE